MAFAAEELELLRRTVVEAVESAQENLAQMVARQFVDLREDIQEVQEAIRKVGARQVQVEADLAEIGRNSELIKRRLLDLAPNQPGTDWPVPDRDLTFRLNMLEREVAELRTRLASTAE